MVSGVNSSRIYVTPIYIIPKVEIGYLFDIQNQPELAIFFYKHCLINRETARLNP